MTTDSSPDPLTAWSSLLFRALADAGVRDVVISPGSRSTPFVLAAAREERLRCWDVIDERSAAFFALGQAKATGRPSLLLCTSGSAGAHYYPAIIEAEASHTPLLVLTADRPLELQACAAPQTIDQVKLFGDRVRGFFELGLPADDATALRAAARLVAQATLTARWPVPGPVHLNARARKPLEPHPPADAHARAMGQRIARSEVRPPAYFVPRMAPDAAGVGDLAAALRNARAPLFVAGPGPLGQRAAAVAVGELIQRSNGVLLAEATSQFRFGQQHVLSAFDVYVDAPALATRLAPDLILQLGAAPQSTAFGRYLERHLGIPRWVVAPHGWNDPESSATHLLFGELGDVAAGLNAQIPEIPGEANGWQLEWQRIDAAATAALTRHAEAGASLVEGSVIREAVRTLDGKGCLFIGNSLPLRELDLFCPSDLGSCGVLSQRGANGIDGLLSGAAGAASTGLPVTLVLGDVSFLHDAGGLATAALAKSPLRIVVLNNGGGRIFEDLPLGGVADSQALTHFTTPHQANLSAAAAVWGLSYRRVATRAELRQALAGTTPSVIDAVVPQRGLRQLRAELLKELQGVLA